MPHSWPRAGAAPPCIGQRASNRVCAGQLMWCQVKDSSRWVSSWRRTCHSRHATIGSVRTFLKPAPPATASRRSRGTCERPSNRDRLLGRLFGGGGKTGVSGPSGASLVRSTALAFVSIDSDLGSSQWQQVDDLSHKFPGRSKALERLRQELAKHDIDYGRDVEPALGPEVDLAAAAGSTPNATSFVVLTKPDDADKYKELVKKLNASDTSGKPAVYREVNGWYALSDSQAKIDATLKPQAEDALS